MFGRVSGFLLALIVPLVPLGAQEFDLGEFVVTSTRTRTEVLEAPGHVSVITAGEIEESGAGNIAELLRSRADLPVNDYGPAGAVKTLTIRGSSSSQVLVLLNGMRLNDARDGGVDLSAVPLDGIERIEVVRGGLSAVHGADAVGGVINIVTKRKSEDRIRLQLENGGYLPRDAVRVEKGGAENSVSADPLDLLDTQRLRLELSRSVGSSDLVAAGSFTRAANAFVWYDDEYIDDSRRRINADLLGGDLYLGWSLPVTDGSLGVTGLFSLQENGSPGDIDPTGISLSTDARQTRMSVNGQVEYNAERFLSDLLSLDASLSYRYDRLDFLDPGANDDRHATHTVTFEAMQEWYASEPLSLLYGGNITVGVADSTQIGDRQRMSGGVFLEMLLAPLTGLTVTPALRYDYYSDFPDRLNGRLSIVYNLSRSVSLKADLATSYRAPTLNELYWPADVWTRGNPDLRPETGYSGELGVTWLGERLELNTFVFARYMLDMIDWADDGTGVYQPTNVQEALYPGAELSLSVRPFDGWQISAGYTFNYSFLLDTYSFSDDQRVANVPVNIANFSIQYQDRRNQARLDAEYTGRRFNSFYTKELDPYLLLNARYRRVLGDSIALSVSIRNLLNQAVQAMDDYILPPISFWTGVEVTF